MPTSSPRAVGKGDLVDCASEKKGTRRYFRIQQAGLRSVFCAPRCTPRNLWGLDQPDENYIRTRATSAYTAYIMQQTRIGARMSMFDNIFFF